MPNLYPTFDMPDPMEQQIQLEPEYPESYLFDFASGDFVIDGAGRVAKADGHTAWAQWCVKTVLTERFAYLVYSWNHGAETEKALKQPSRAAVEADLERTITEALLVDSRTQIVKDFEFAWEGDQLRVSFVAVSTIGRPEWLEVIYNAA